MQHDIRKCFTSRWGDDGVIMEADYSQLEILVLAYLSGDTALCEDMLSGRDLHTMRAADLYGIGEHAVTKLQRKNAKVLSFQLQYGAGAKSMAADLGLSEHLCQKFIDNYYARYPEVKTFQDDNIAEVESLRVSTSEHTLKGLPKGKATLNTLTGRRYVFEEYDNPYYKASNGWSKPTKFSPTQIKNYPVQGFATGDIVPLVLGAVYHALVAHKDNALLINTVHDSILLDVRREAEYSIGALVKEVMEDAPRMLLETFDITFDLPLTVEVKSGKDWSSMTVLSL